MSTILMFQWSSSVLNPELANDVIHLEESGILSLDDSVNQLINVIDPAMWNDSNFSLLNISVYTVFQLEQMLPWLFITMCKGYSRPLGITINITGS